MLTPGFARRDLERSAAPADLARGRELAGLVEDLDWDEYSVSGCLPGQGITTGELLLHHGERPLTGECPCQRGRGAGLCAHMAALAWAVLGDDDDLADRLTAMSHQEMSHQELVALVVDLAGRSASAREAIWSRPGGRHRRTHRTAWRRRHSRSPAGQSQSGHRPPRGAQAPGSGRSHSPNPPCTAGRSSRPQSHSGPRQLRANPVDARYRAGADRHRHQTQP